MTEESGQGSFFWEKPSTGLPNLDNQVAARNKMALNPFFLSSNSTTPTSTSTPSTPLCQSRVIKSDGGGSSGGDDWTESKVGDGSSDHDAHIFTERERRKKMRNMFSTLQALLPHLPPKVDKSTIIDEAASCIKSLEHTLESLERKKLEIIQGVQTMDYDPSMVRQTNLSLNSREAYLADQVSSKNPASHSLSVQRYPVSFQTWSSPNFSLNVCGEDAQLSICAPKKPGLLTTILCVLEKHKLDVMTVQISSDHYRSMFMIHAHARRTFDQLQEALFVEEKFKLAVAEMIFWISS